MLAAGVAPGLAVAVLSACTEPVVELPMPPPVVDEGPVETWASEVRPAVPGGGDSGEIRKAAMDDRTHVDDELVSVRRLVYRVSFIVSPAFHERHMQLTAPAGELHVDVAERRLRARFVGPGWPVAEGTEVRLRSDVPGVYVFDALGGRPLSPGQMASWFEGRKSGRSGSNVRVRRESGVKPRGGPGEMMCALLAEWTNQPRRKVVPRCANGMLPPGFRFGPWSAELTALVPIEMPRRALRADEVDPPPPATGADRRMILDASELARLKPRRGSAGSNSGDLEFVNNTATSVLVLVGGTVIGWVDAESRGRFGDFSPGRYNVGAVRPLGVLRMAPKLRAIPGSVTLGRRADE